MRARPACVALALLAAACEGGGSGARGADEPPGGTVRASGPPSAQTASVDMTDALVFRPGTVEAVRGSLALTAKNVGRVPHDLVFADAGMGRTGRVEARGNATLTLDLDRVGSFRFTCTIHRGMSGRLVVTG